MNDDQGPECETPAQQRVATGVNTPDDFHVQHPRTLPGDNRDKNGRGIAGEGTEAVPTPLHGEPGPGDGGPSRPDEHGPGTQKQAATLQRRVHV